MKTKNQSIRLLLILGLLIAVRPTTAQTWMQTSAPSNGDWHGVASSADGTKLAAVNWGRIYTSTNSGLNWVSNDVPYALWIAIASSADGNKLAAAAGYGGGIYISTNSGVVWMQTNAPTNNWLSIASSADGNLLIAAAASQTNGLIFISTNSGASWTQTTAPTNYYWTSVAASADGCKLVAAAGHAFGGPGYRVHLDTVLTMGE
jgi:hypothetical protein